jgi:hypothetical protein
MSLFAALAAVVALSGPADDLSDLKPQDKADLQCMTVLVVAIGMSEDQNQKAGLATGATYFFGRLQGRTPDTDWLARFSTYIRTEPAADLEANRARCSAEVGAMASAFTRAGDALSGS